MQSKPQLVLLLLAGCAGAPSPTTVRVPVKPPIVAQWPAGTRFRAELDRRVPDELPWRAASVWWREALRQTVAFELTDAEVPALPVLLLSIDPTARTVAATWRDGTHERALAGGRFVGTDLPTAIDELALAARLALGEDAVDPLAVAVGTSRDPRVVLAVHDAEALLRDGGVTAAANALRDARVRDGGSPFVLDTLAAIALLRGDLALAERTAREALGYEARLLPTVQHRLARTLLLARAAQAGERAANFDRELRLLAETTLRERPHDPQPALTAALAANFLGDTAQARTQLLALRERLAQQPTLLQHLGLACLASGDATAAVAAFEAARVHLPVAWTVLPLSIALYEAGQHDELRRRLRAWIDDDDPELAPLRHELLRMQAAHALLRGDEAAAKAGIEADFNWLLKNPTVLTRSVGEFAEAGAVLVRLGGGGPLRPLLAAVQQQHDGEPVTDACAFLAAMADIAERPGRRAAVESTLSRGGDSAFAALLAAFAHERAGELGDALTWLGRAARLAPTPMTKALLARSLRTAGRVEEARTLRDTLHGEQRTLRLRSRWQHPLLGPELAFAFALE